MKLKFGFTNGTPSAEFNIDTIQATPLELLVSQQGTFQSRKRAMQLYIKTLDYAFKGVSNYASGDISGVEIEKPWFGRVLKHMDYVEWEAVTDKTFVVVYDFSLESLTENMYVADAIQATKKGNKNSINPVWIKELLTPKPYYMLQNMISSIAIVTEFSPHYKIAWGFEGKEDLTVLTKDHKPITVEDIEDDEFFILIKLLTLIMSKGVHMGVFLIDARGFSDRVLEAITHTVKAFYGDAFLFLYNLNPNSKLNRKTIELPNFLHK